MARKNPKIFSPNDPERPKHTREKKKAAIPNRTHDRPRTAMNVVRTLAPLSVGAAVSAVVDTPPDAATLEDEDVALPPVISVICLRPGDPAGRDAAALAWEEVVAA